MAQKENSKIKLINHKNDFNNKAIKSPTLTDNLIAVTELTHSFKEGEYIGKRPFKQLYFQAKRKPIANKYKQAFKEGEEFQFQNNTNWNDTESKEGRDPLRIQHKNKYKLKRKQRKHKRLEPMKTMSLDCFLRKNDIPPENFIKNIVTKEGSKPSVMNAFQSDQHLKKVIRKILKNETLPLRYYKKMETGNGEYLPLAKNPQIKDMMERANNQLKSEVYPR